MPEACHVADQFCEHAANYEGHACRSRCFACGEPTCVACSIKMTWYAHGRKRICHDCLINELGEDGYRRVMSHLASLAGYPPGYPVTPIHFRR